MSEVVSRLCTGCGAPLSPTRAQRLCGPCMGKRTSRGKKRAQRRHMDGVDIDAIHFNPRWKKIKEAA